MDPFVALIRRYVVDYTNRQDTTLPAEIMEPDFTLRMGRHVLAGRDDAYLPAAQKQFDQFPGLGLTVHEIVTNGERLAMRFSEHGASVRHGGALASWAGTGLYRWNGTRLVDTWVEQDYLARRRQLAGGPPDPVEPPAVAPWDTLAEPADPAAEQAVRAWIAAGLPGPGVRWDDGDPTPVLDVESTDTDDLFSAGDAVGFRLSQHGRRDGQEAILHLVGVVHVDGDQVVRGQIVRDRLGLTRALAHPQISVKPS